MEDIICKRCGSVNDFSATPSGPHLKATCNKCGQYIKFLPQQQTKPTLYFGKYRGREISSMNSEEDLRYLQWLISQPDLKPKLKTDIQFQLKRLGK